MSESEPSILPKRLRFTTSETMNILHDVIYENPYENPDKWEIITKRIIECSSKNFTVRTVREHVEHNVKKWAHKNSENMKK